MAMDKVFSSRCIVIWLMALSLLVGCEKEIDIDYHEIEPIMVVEGVLTNEDLNVIITSSRSMENPNKELYITDCLVTVSSDEGWEEILVYDASRHAYRSPSGRVGSSGHTYQLRIVNQGKEYVASSFMPQPSDITATRFFWMTVLDERFLAYDVLATDPQPEERNYFWYRFLRNDTVYRWNAFDDRGCPPGAIFREVLCMTETMAEENKEEDHEHILYEGDKMYFELYSIDRASYEYFQSLAMSSRTGSNPKGNINGGCLGFFTAAYVSHIPPFFFTFEGIEEWDKETFSFPIVSDN